jgi:hypothetical protein
MTKARAIMLRTKTIAMRVEVFNMEKMMYKIYS